MLIRVDVSLFAFRLVLMWVNKRARPLARPHPFQRWLLSITSTSLPLPVLQPSWSLPPGVSCLFCSSYLPSSQYSPTCRNISSTPLPPQLLDLLSLSFRGCEWIYAERSGQVKESLTSLLPVPQQKTKRFPPKKGRETDEAHSTSLPQSWDQDDLREPRQDTESSQSFVGGRKHYILRLNEFFRIHSCLTAGNGGEQPIRWDFPWRKIFFLDLNESLKHIMY